MKKLLLLTPFLLALLLACEQNEGERCEIDDDCASGLKCCKPASTPEGTCQTEENCQ